MDMETLEIVQLTEQNLTDEHICCCIGDAKCEQGYQMKKDWIRDRLPEGFVFKKLNVRGKVFIEYLPAEFAWRPIEAPGYMCIQCFWVSGKYKDQGWGKKLFDACEADSQGMHGIVTVTSSKKRPFLTDKSYFIKQGFEVADFASPYFELLVKRLNDAPLPRFAPHVKDGSRIPQDGLVLMYSDQCPFADYYIDEMLNTAAGLGISGRKIHLTTLEQVQQGPSPFGVLGAYYNGVFLTHELMAAKGFEKLLREKVLS